MPLIHLAECEPDADTGWVETTFRDAVAAGARMCPETVYMGDEMVAEEPVWLDEHGRFGDWLLTFTGRRFWPFDARPDDIDPRDIAHALSMLCRYGGHVSSFYSVAEHCVLTSHAVPPGDALWALLHDGTEEFMQDLVAPVKRMLPGYAAAEDRLMTVVCDRFRLPHACPASVKEADTRILVDERAALLPRSPWGWKSTENVLALNVPIAGWDPAYAEQRYLDRLVELTGVPL